MSFRYSKKVQRKYKNSIRNNDLNRCKDELAKQVLLNDMNRLSEKCQQAQLKRFSNDNTKTDH